MKRNKGITLIALVITIIVLLILAGVTIATLAGGNGLLTKASGASESTKQANAEEQVKLAVAGSIGTDGNINNSDLKTNLDRIENIEGVPNEITDASYPFTVNIDGYDVTIKKDGNTILGTLPGNPNKETGIFTEPSTINGENGNKNNPIIPAGFKPVDEGEATWGDGTIEPAGVNKGLVIEDEDENQYVWIPVDGILGDDVITLQNVVDKEIILGRYVFSSGGNINTTLSPETLGGELKTSSTDSYNYTEASTGKNTVAKDINGFINSVRKNGGYYIARFEASQGSSSKANSQYNKTVWSNITQPNAAKACQDLYEGVNSDLINSYAWDTAILFIQKYGKNNYSMQNSLNTDSAVNTGLSGDVQLNIYDMASNCLEYTTETYSDSGTPCVLRGGYYSRDYFYTSSRGQRTSTNYGTAYSSFRPILYL